MHRPILIAAGLCSALLLAAGPVAGEDRAADFAEFEERLIRAEAVRVDFAIVSEGVLTTDLQGSLDIRGEKISLEADGTFGGSPVDLILAVSGTEISGGNLALADASLQEFTIKNPGAAREAVILGMTRMGLLHNLALLTGSRPPDRAAGGIRDWVRASNVRSAGDGGLAFDILVDGQDAAEAVVLLDSRTLPERRDQTNRFPAGEMRVVETYRVFEVVDGR